MLQEQMAESLTPDAEPREAFHGPAHQILTDFSITCTVQQVGRSVQSPVHIYQFHFTQTESKPCYISEVSRKVNEAINYLMHPEAAQSQACLPALDKVSMSLV